MFAFAALSASLLVARPGDQYPPDPAEEEPESGIKWAPILWQSLFFTGVEHGFRIASQDYTRHALRGPFFHDWAESIGNLHGWADGDPFLTNYVGHPMQGAVSGYIFAQNDGRYRKVEFGRDRDYWKSRLRATAFSFAFSQQFEIGPLSEASLGNTQQYFPQQGFVDQVITPTVGLAWMIGEDALDKYVVSRLESRTQNRWLRMSLRAGLNPSRSMANAMRLQVPWHRDTRPGIFADMPRIPKNAFLAPVGPDPAPETLLEPRSEKLSDLQAELIPTLEVAAYYSYYQLALGKTGSIACNGGGATATLNLNRWAGITADVTGCKMHAPGENLSGDVLNYLIGPRYTLRQFARWTPFVQFLAGGTEFTNERFYPESQPASPPSVTPGDPNPAHSLYTSQDQTNAFAIEFGGGLDYNVNRAVALRVAEVEDVHTWARDLNGRQFPDNLRISTGFSFRFGTW